MNRRWEQIRRCLLNKKGFAVCSLVLFAIFGAFKIGVFNRLIVEAGAFPLFTGCFSGYTNKVILLIAFSVIFTRFRSPFVIIVFYVLQTLYILINVMYYLSFQGYLHISQYTGLFSEAFDLITHAALPWDTRSLFAFLDLPFLIGIIFIYRQLYELKRNTAFI